MTRTARALSATLALAAPGPVSGYGGGHVATARVAPAVPRPTAPTASIGADRPAPPLLRQFSGGQGIHGSVQFMADPSRAFQSGSHGDIGLDPRRAAALGAFR